MEAVGAVSPLYMSDGSAHSHVGQYEGYYDDLLASEVLSNTEGDHSAETRNATTDVVSIG